MNERVFALCVCVCVLTLRARVRIRGEFHVVAWKQTLPPIELSLPPVTVVFVQHRDDLSFLEGQFVVVLRHVVVHADHLTHSFRTRHTLASTNLSTIAALVLLPQQFQLGFALTSAGGSQFRGGGLGGRRLAGAGTEQLYIVGWKPADLALLPPSLKQPEQSWYLMSVRGGV